MSDFRLYLLAAILFISPTYAFSESAPESIRHSMLITPSDKAIAKVKASRAELINDSAFIANLRDMLTDSSLSPNDKVDVFVLMLRKISWAFNGAVQLPPGFDYINFFTGQAGTYYKYSQSLDVSLDPNPFWDIARNLRLVEPAKAGHAVLLGTIISSSLAEPNIKSFLSSYQNDSVLFFHPLILASVLTDSPDVTKLLVGLLDKVKGEESLEDIICAISLLNTEYSSEGVSQFVKTRTQKPFDLEVETALLAMKSHMKMEIFADFYSTLLSKVTDEGAKKHLNDFRDQDFRYSLMDGTTGVIKVWDDSSMVIYDNGYLITNKDMQDFVEK